MPSSGILVPDDVINSYLDMKKNKQSSYIKFCIENNVLKIAEVKPKTDAFDIKKDIPSVFDGKSCCYVVLDFTWTNEEGTDKDRLLFVSWAPDEGTVKEKMLYATTKIDLLNKLEGIQVKVQACDATDITYECLLKAVKSSLTRQ